MTYRVTTDELYHHGIRGQKWGVRRFQNADGSLKPAGEKRYGDVEASKTAYKDAKARFKQTRKDAHNPGIGIKGIQTVRKGIANYRKHEFEMIDAKAKYAAAKAKTQKQADKAEMKVYRKEMQKSGLVGSAWDNSTRILKSDNTISNGRSTDLYNHMVTKRGQEYADKVHKKVQNVAVASIAGSAAVMLGATAIEAYLNTRY